MNVRVTVVTPVFNGAEHVRETVHSVQRQSFTDYEHLVVDDGSTDDTATIVREESRADRRIRLIGRENGGLSAARNTGAAHASPGSDYILFLDHDDLLRPRALELLVAALDGRPDALAVHGAVAGIDATGKPTPLVRIEAASRRHVREPERLWTPRTATRELDTCEDSDFASLAYVLYIYTVGQVLIRRDALAEIGAFDPLLRVAQDYDMWLRLSAVQPIAFIPEVVLDYRQTTGSLSSDQTTTRREDLHARFKAITAESSPPATRALARNLHRHHEWHRAAARIDLLKEAMRKGDVRDGAREAVRAARSAVEAGLATPHWEWPFAMRVRRFRDKAVAP
jgi:glycosyltransferase involved in cell wall biosynthesis